MSQGGAFAVEHGMDAPVPLDSADAAGRFANVNLIVTDVPCGQGAGETASFRLLIDSADQLELLERGLQDMGDLVVFLSTVDGSAQAVYALPVPGALVARVSPDGDLNFVGMTGATWEGFFDGIKSVDELREACPNDAA